MRRRDLIGAAGLAAWPGQAESAEVRTDVVRLKLRHTWTTVMSSSDYRDNLHVQFKRDGVTGFGEAAPIVRYKENVDSARKAVESVADLLRSADPWHFSKLLAEVFEAAVVNDMTYFG